MGVLDNPTNMDELRDFFSKIGGATTTDVAAEGEVLNNFNPTYTIVKDGSGRTTTIDVTFGGKTARKTFTYPDAVTTVIGPWTLV